MHQFETLSQEIIWENFEWAIWRAMRQIGGANMPCHPAKNHKARLQALDAVIDWCQRNEKIPAMIVPADPEVVNTGPAITLIDGLSPDGLTLRWGGIQYPLSTTAARLVKLLVETFENGFPYLHEEYLKTEGEFENNVRHIVRDAGLESIVVREVGANGKVIKGKWGLIDPEKVLLPR
jgi:hypothetical protein